MLSVNRERIFPWREAGEHMGKRRTVYDVAAAAGVSIATVSFAFTKPERVKRETLEMVLATADRLGYVPSANARGLASGHTGALGLYAFDYLLEPEPGKPATTPNARLFPLYSDEVQRGVQLECRHRGYALMLGAGRNPGHLPPVIDVAGRVDGLIAFAGAASTDVLLQMSRRMPVLQLGGDTKHEGLHTILVDGNQAMRNLTEHLLTVHGFRRFVYIGTEATAEFVARYEGFAQTLAAAGVPVPPYTDSEPGDDASTEAVIGRAIASGALPDVFVCASDQEALVAIDLLTRAGHDVPGEVAVTGFDGILAGRLTHPQLTTVRQPMEEIGRAAVRILADIIGGDDEADRYEVLRCSLSIGQSCGCSR